MSQITQEILEQALEMRKEGHTFKAIASELGVAEATLFKKLKKMDEKPEKVNTETTEAGIPSHVRSKLNTTKTPQKPLNMDNLQYILEIERLQYDLSRVKENAERDLKDAEKEYQRLKEKYKEVQEKHEKADKELQEIKEKNDGLKKQANILSGIGNYVLPILSSPLLAGLLPKGMQMQEHLNAIPEQEASQFSAQILQDHEIMQSLRDAFGERYNDLSKIINLLLQKTQEIDFILNHLQSNSNPQYHG